MKKLLLILIVILSCSLSSFAQAEPEQLLKEMEKLQEELMKQFGGFGFQFDDPQLQIDTFFYKGFGNGEDWMPLDGESFDLTEMMNLLQEQLQQMDAQDWEDLDQLFKGFGGFEPFVPAPDSLDQFPEEGKPADQPKKKRKVYSL